MVPTCLKDFVKALPWPAAVVDLATHRLAACSPVFAATLDLASDCQGQCLASVLPSNIADPLNLALDNSARDQEPRRFEMKLGHADSKPSRRLMFNVQPMYSDGACWATLTLEPAGVPNEVENVAIARAMLDNAPAVIYAKDRLGRYQMINQRFEELFDVDRNTIRGATDFDVFSADQARVFVENDQLVLNANDSIEFEEIARQDDGPHTFISLKFPYRDAEGRAIGVCGISTDITPRKQVEAALRESEERFRQLAENISECFWVTDCATLDVLYVSPAYERIWGRTCESLYQDKGGWIAAIHPDDRERVEQSFVENAPQGEFSEQYRVVRPDGKIRWIWDRGFPILDDQGRVFRIAGIAQDITSQRQLEYEVAQISSHERWRISRELHDSVGQQLTGVGLLAKRLAQRLAIHLPTEADKAETILVGVQEAIAEVRSVVRGLSPVEFDAQGLTAALQSLSTSISERFPIDCAFDCPSVVAIADNNVASELFRIAQEAINNAVKHASPRQITISLTSLGNQIEMSVADDGTGFLSNGKVPGMGLRIMKYRASMIGAELRIGSLEESMSTGRGTLVSVRLKQDTDHGN